MFLRILVDMLKAEAHFWKNGINRKAVYVAENSEDFSWRVLKGYIV